MGSVVDGRRLEILVKNGTGKPKRAIMNAPLGVFGKICAKSAGDVLIESKSKRSSESISVKLFVLLIGMSARAVLIQNISMAGRTEKPINDQPMGYLKYSKAMPPVSRAMNSKSESARNGGVLKRCF